MKLIKKFQNSGKIQSPMQVIHHSPYDVELVLEKDPIPEEEYQFENQYPGITTNYQSGYGSTPQIRQDLPKDHPINVRNAIAQTQGWVEVSAKDIDINANKQWENKIRQDILKYGPDSKYIVDPITRKIVTESQFNKIKTDIAWRNGSEAIADDRVRFEIQQAQNRRAMQRFNDQMDAATLGLIAVGAAPFVIPEAVSAISASGIPAAATTVGNAIRPFIKPALASYVFASGMDQAKQDWEAGNYGLAALDATGAMLNAAFPFSKAGTLLQYAPRVGIPMAILGGTASAYAEEPEPYNPYPQDETDDPHDFVSPLTDDEQQSLKEKLDDPTTNWAELGDDEQSRAYWSNLIQKELQAAHFKFSPSMVNDRSLIVIRGNKGEGLENYLKNLQNQEQNPSVWGEVGYQTARNNAPWGLYKLYRLFNKGAKKTVDTNESPGKLAKFFKRVKGGIKKHPGTSIWVGSNLAFTIWDLFDKNSWERRAIREAFGDPNQNIDNWNDQLPEYYNKLINAYAMLNSRSSNVDVHGSTFSKYQTFSTSNIDPRTGYAFSAPDTMAVMQLGPTQIGDTTNQQAPVTQEMPIDSNLYVGN